MSLVICERRRSLAAFPHLVPPYAPPPDVPRPWGCGGCASFSCFFLPPSPQDQIVCNMCAGGSRRSNACPRPRYMRCSCAASLHVTPAKIVILLHAPAIGTRHRRHRHHRGREARQQEEQQDRPSHGPVYDRLFLCTVSHQDVLAQVRVSPNLRRGARGAVWIIRGAAVHPRKAWAATVEIAHLPQAGGCDVQEMQTHAVRVARACAGGAAAMTLLMPVPSGTSAPRCGLAIARRVGALVLLVDPPWRQIVADATPTHLHDTGFELVQSGNAATALLRSGIKEVVTVTIAIVLSTIVTVAPATVTIALVNPLHFRVLLRCKRKVVVVRSTKPASPTSTTAVPFPAQNMLPYLIWDTSQ
ncbi:hypothetical protein, conserved [Leishmania tarentolae]|uniref:Uncharacterized protein n=1 Tax=Leishmania tarentolae TaxID=5689 RepID=A0A640KAQ5_LEITA|nr:hypothetical protein, conserved [Leishmania tarentolae]